MTKLLSLLLLCAGMCFAPSGASAQHFYVHVRPVATVVVRPAPPSPRHVWVDAEWGWVNGQYVESRAHWEEPPAGFHVWIAGHWVHTSHGEYWVRGHWRH
jgi:hypothetical protein